MSDSLGSPVPPSRGAGILTLGTVALYGLSFLRNLILARLLTKADFGLAALFSNTLAMLELASRMSFGQQIVQSPQGASREFRDSAHGFQLVTALIGAALILGFGLVAAPFVARSDVGWALASLALVPIARGFENLDLFGEQRRFNQTPGVLCELVPQLVTTLAVWPLALWLGDFRVVLCILIGKPLLGMLLTHVVAFEPFGVSWNRDHFRSIAKFGWPLVLNGLLMFVSLQADQFLVAGFLSTEDSASYALAFSLASVPWALLSQPTVSLMLPLLSRLQDQPDRFREYYRSCVAFASIGAVALTFPLIVFGEQFVTLLFGRKYVGAGPLVAVLGAATVCRFLRFTPAIASMAHADTRNQLDSNLVRATSLPLAALAVAAGWGAVGVAIASLLSEIAAGIFSTVRLARRQAVPVRDNAEGVLFVGAFLALGAVLVWAGAPAWSIPSAASALPVALGGVLLAAWLAFPQTARPLAREMSVRIRALRPYRGGYHRTDAR